jgi:carbonic anhydrase/acetyltransferase-like protein (isoleucine patch superfamily)
VTTLLPFGDKTPLVAPSVFVASNATIIGDVVVGEDSSLWFNVVLRGDVSPIRIGCRTNIQDGTVIHVSDGGPGTDVGDDVTVGHMALLHACTIESFAFIGMKACVMDGAVVESGAMVAAGALVTPSKRVLAGQLWAGTPARFMRPVSEIERAYFGWSAANYVKLAGAYSSGDGRFHPAAVEARGSGVAAASRRQARGDT